MKCPNCGAVLRKYREKTVGYCMPCWMRDLTVWDAFMAQIQNRLGPTSRWLVVDLQDRDSASKEAQNRDYWKGR